MSAYADKIRKLLAKANSTTHPEEAEAFMTKARALMEEHGISLLDLGRLNTDDPVGLDRSVYRANINDRWRFYLIGQLARYYGCKTVYTPEGGNRDYHIVGRESARITFQLMWPFIDRQVMAMAREDVKRGIYRTVSTARHKIGYALAVRISQLLQQSTATEGQGVNALVPVDLIEAAMDHYFPGATEGKKRQVSFDVNAQRRAGEVSLHQQVSPNAAQRRIS